MTASIAKLEAENRRLRAQSAFSPAPGLAGAGFGIGALGLNGLHQQLSALRINENSTIIAAVRVMCANVLQSINPLTHVHLAFVRLQKDKRRKQKRRGANQSSSVNLMKIR